MTDPEISRLRVLIANERRDWLELLAQVVAGLGHEVIAREVEVTEVGAVMAMPVSTSLSPKGASGSESPPYPKVVEARSSTACP